MLMVTQFVDPIKTWFWTHVYMKWNSQGGNDCISGWYHWRVNVCPVWIPALRDIHPALSVEDQKVVIKGWEILRKSTAGWDICCKWKDGYTSWEKLSNLKELHPVQVAGYAIAQGIEYEPAFNWWVHHVLQKRDRIISMARKCSAWYLKRTHKFGFELPKIVNEALYAIDKKNGSTLW